MITSQWWLIAIAVTLDLLWGDPKFIPHPVIYIGKFISFAEKHLYNISEHRVITGFILLVSTVSATVAVSFCILKIISLAPFYTITIILTAIFSSTALAAKSLHFESKKVADAVISGNIELARRNLSYIVGRDTENLSEAEIWRALIETVAENSSDGIVAPIFYLAIGGPIAAIGYKSVNTLDSMVGYRNERYEAFGKASARFDDILNFIPARITALLIIFAAPICRLSFSSAWKIFLRDRKKHPSPNSAHPESAAAGALQIRLGGVSTYRGKKSVKEHIGDDVNRLNYDAYCAMIRLMYATTAFAAIAAILLRMLF